MTSGIVAYAVTLFLSRPAVILRVWGLAENITKPFAANKHAERQYQPKHRRWRHYIASFQSPPSQPLSILNPEDARIFTAYARFGSHHLFFIAIFIHQPIISKYIA